MKASFHPISVVEIDNEANFMCKQFFFCLVLISKLNVCYQLNVLWIEWIMFGLTFPHCLHFPFSVRRWIQWWRVLVCSRYWRTPTSRNVGLHANCARSINREIQLAWAMILHAEHFIRGPCFCRWLLIACK